MDSANYSKRIFYILMFFAAMLLGMILKVTMAVSIPVIVSILLTCVFYPVVKKLNQKLKFPWIFGTIIMIMATVIIIILLSTIIGASLTAFSNQYSKYEFKFLSIYKIFADKLNIQFYADKSFFENIWSQLKLRNFIQQAAFSFSGNLFSITKMLCIIFLFTIFLLIEMKICKDKINIIFNGKIPARIHKITKKVINDTVRFISIKFFISIATGLLVYVTAVITRMDFAIIWAFFAFVMNFIPTFGSIFSTGITTIFALLQFYPDPIPTVSIFISITIINIVLGNIVEPKIEGENLGISPFVILVSLTFWGWMWGFTGMILAVPLTVILKIICENISFLQGFAILIGNKPSDMQIK